MQRAYRLPASPALGAIPLPDSINQLRGQGTAVWNPKQYPPEWYERFDRVTDDEYAQEQRVADMEAKHRGVTPDQWRTLDAARTYNGPGQQVRTLADWMTDVPGDIMGDDAIQVLLSLQATHFSGYMIPFVNTATATEAAGERVEVHGIGHGTVVVTNLGAKQRGLAAMVRPEVSAVLGASQHRETLVNRHETTAVSRNILHWTGETERRSTSPSFHGDEHCSGHVRWHFNAKPPQPKDHVGG